MLNVDKIKDVLLAGSVSLILATCSYVLGFGFVAVFVTSWLLSTVANFYIGSLKVCSSGKCVLITGCDSGFGYNLALHLHNLGFEVFAGCLQAESGGGAEHLKSIDPERLHVLQLNVTKESELNEAFVAVKKTVSAKKKVLWGIVNNAGISTSGEAEWVPMDTFKRVTEVNVFGLVNTTKIFLPLLRLSKGRVVNISSMMGRMAMPMGSAYTASKYAVEGFSDCLRKEVHKWGIHVSIIEPGNLIPATQISSEEQVKCEAESMWHSMDKELKDGLGRFNYDLLVDASMLWKRLGLSEVTIVIEAMTDALTQRYPRVRYLPMEFYNWVCVLIANLLPECVFDTGCNLMISLLVSSLRRQRKES